jgi:hypothetical protein
MFDEAEKDFLIGELEGRKFFWERNVQLYKTDIEINPHNLDYTEEQIDNLRNALQDCQESLDKVETLIKKLS